jgi:hypothetical protein
VQLAVVEASGHFFDEIYIYAEVQIADYIDGLHREICILSSESTSDGSSSDFYVYGLNTASRRYERLGSIFFGSSETGDVCGAISSGIVDGPHSVINGDTKNMMLIRENSQWLVQDQQDSVECIEEINRYEEIYGLKDGKLSVISERWLSSSSRERE